MEVTTLAHGMSREPNSHGMSRQLNSHGMSCELNFVLWILFSRVVTSRILLRRGVEKDRYNVSFSVQSTAPGRQGLRAGRKGRRHEETGGDDRRLGVDDCFLCRVRECGVANPLC